MSRPLARREMIAWARLARTPGVGALSFQRLVAEAGSAEAALESLARRAGGRFSPPPPARIEAELDAIERIGGRLMASCEPAYPAMLAQLDPCPPLIAARGAFALFERPAVAIVGARDASAAGLKLARDFARGLGELGFVIVSGLARGIDAQVHDASLASGTIAVLAGGLDEPYPPQNLALHDRIAVEGVVLTEAPMGRKARAQDFPRRNHVISGLCLGVVVIEAAQRSGSLITARAAGEQGREVMAVPGSPLDPRARGCNALLKQGALLVETPEDVAEALGALRGGPRPPPPPRFEVAAAGAPPAGLAGKIAALLSPAPVHANDLARLLGAPVNQILAALMELELEGRAVTLTGGFAAAPAP